MEDEESGVPKLSKRFADKNGVGGGEVDYKTKSGTAWSHNFLNQKPWHPLSYPNQRRKWIAEQTHAHRLRRNDEVSREYAQEQDFLRQTSLLSQKEKQKVDLMQAVSFMYVRPPGYNAESAKAAEIVDEKRKLGEIDPAGVASSSTPLESAPLKEEKKKPRPKDVFGRSLPTEEEFAVLKNAPKLETGVAGRAKPFAVEVRNVKCVRCGKFGHQSGDRECPLKDAIMPSEESRLKRDDPLTAIMAQMDPSEPLKWELKQKPGISPPRGGFQPDDPNQQIVAEDIFDEYGGFLSGGIIPELLTNFSSKKQKKKTKSKSKHKRRRSSRSSSEDSTPESDTDRGRTKAECKSKQLKQTSSRSKREGDSCALDSDDDRTVSKSRKNKKRYSPTVSDEDSYSGDNRKTRKKHLRKRERNKKSPSRFDKSDRSDDERYYGKIRHRRSHRRGTESRQRHKDSSSDGERKLSSKDRSRRDRKTVKKDAEFSSSETSETEGQRWKYSRKSSSKRH